GVQRIAFARDKVARDERNVRLQIVRHGDGARDFMRRHVVANMDVTKLSNAQPVKLWRKIGHRHIDALDGIAQTAGGKSIGSGKKRKASSKHSGILKESPARRTEPTRDRSRMRQKPGRNVRDPLNRSHRFNRQESKE